MEEIKPKMTIKEALVLIQKIRYYDKDGNLITKMDEGDEHFYLSDIYKIYDGTLEQIIRKMRIASKLEALGIINTNNPEREKDVSDERKIYPLIRIKRRNDYK